MDLLLAGAAHDLNNIFSQVLMMLELFGTVDLDDEMVEMVDGLRGSVQRGIGIAGQLFDQSSSEPGQKLKVSLKQLASALQKRSYDLVPGAQLASRYPDTVPWVLADPQAVLGLVLDVARSGADETGGGTIEVIVQEHAGEEDTTYVSIGVTAPHSLARALEKDPEKPDHALWKRVHDSVSEQGGWLETAPASQGPLVRICLPAVD